MHPVDQGITSDSTLMPVTQESPVEENRMCDNVRTPSVGENPTDYDNNSNVAGLIPVDEQPPVITELHMNIDQGMAVSKNPTDNDNNSVVRGFIPVDEQPPAIIELQMNVDQGMAVSENPTDDDNNSNVRGFIPVDEQSPVITEPQVHPVDQGMTSDSTSTHVSHEPPIEEDRMSAHVDEEYAPSDTLTMLVNEHTSVNTESNTTHKDTALDINGIPTLLEPISEGMESACGHSLSKPADQLTMPGGVQMCMPTPLGGLFYTFPTLPPMGDYDLPKPTGEGMTLDTYSALDINGLQTRTPAPLEHHCYTFSTVPTMMDYGLPKPIEEGIALDDGDLWTFEDAKSSSIKRYVDIDSMQEQLTNVASDSLVSSFSGNPTQTPDVPSPDAPSPWTSFLQRETKIFLEPQEEIEVNVKKDDNENDDMEKAVENQSCLFIAPDMEKSRTKLPFSRSDGIRTGGRKFKLRDNIEDSAKPAANEVDTFMKNGPHALSNATRKMGYDGSRTLAALGYTDRLVALECLTTDFGNTTCIKHRHERHSKQDSSVTSGEFRVDGVPGPRTISKSKATNNKNRSRIYNLENADFLDCGCTVESALTELLWINTWNVRGLVENQTITEPMIPPKDLFGFRRHDIVAQNIQKETLLNIDDYYTGNINITFDQDEERRRMLMVTCNIIPAEGYDEVLSQTNS
ncbi:hypothetical protein BDQ17DRAFT_1438829 [Cyathus striatus]|nr:hypothetical protein BDQ17DRAFT_1438829 [Cyathus striatus]